MKTVNDLAKSVTEDRNCWPNLEDKLDYIHLNKNREVKTSVPVSNKVGLDSQVYMYTRNDQKTDTRRPQGIARISEYIVNSWYFLSGAYKNNCKLTIMNTRELKYRNVVPVQVNNEGKFVKIESHAGGLAIIDTYLYLADSSASAIRVFDLSSIYPRSTNQHSIQSTQKFINEYDYMIPQVGKIELNAPGSVSYMSIAYLDGNEYFLVGNFYSVSSKYKKGDKSMIWLLPVIKGQHEFPSVDISPSQGSLQMDPLFPSGPNKDTTLTRVQGTLIKDNTLILNRSYGKSTKQLIVMQYNNINTDTSPQKYFSGTPNKPLSHDPQNWLYGCEDLSFGSSECCEVLTQTEFEHKRYTCSFRYEQFIDLLAAH